MSANPLSGNPILDAWLAAWTNGLNLTTQLTSAWLGGQQSSNPWAALMGGLSGGRGGGTMGTGWPMASMAGTGAANPWAGFGGGTANNPFAALAGLQSLMSLAMAPWGNLAGKLGGGAAPQKGGFPFPWNAGSWNAGNLGNFGSWTSGMAGSPATGQRMPFGTSWPPSWPPSWPMTLGFPGMAGLTTTSAIPALPWPWNQFFPPQPSAATSTLGWPPGLMGPIGSTPPTTPPVAENDPMGFGQAMKFWSSLMPAATPAGPSQPSKPEPAPASANAAPDLTKLFPWMAWMK